MGQVSFKNDLFNVARVLGMLDSRGVIHDEHKEKLPHNVAKSPCATGEYPPEGKMSDVNIPYCLRRSKIGNSADAYEGPPCRILNSGSCSTFSSSLIV